MILVRDEMQCKFGRAQDMIAQFQAAADQLSNQDVIKSVRILTDLSGPFDTVIMESEVESIDDYYALLHAWFANPEFQARQQEAGESPVNSGKRSFYTIEAVHKMNP